MLGKKDSILGAAIGLFSKRPYHMVAMDDIARKARVAKGTLYYHFRSKEDLYAALLRDGLDNLLMRLKAESNEDTVEDLKLFINGLAEFFSEKREFFEVLKREEGKLLSKKLKNCYEKTCSVKGLLHCILQKGMDEGIFRSSLNVQIISEIILGMIKSAIDGKIETKKLSGTIFDMLIYGIKA